MTDFTDALQAALWAGGRGWKVHDLDHPSLDKCAGIRTKNHDPDTCTKRGKHPCTAFSKTATSDPAAIAAMFAGTTRNVGIAAGASGLLIIDEDDPGSFSRMAARFTQPVPDTFMVNTSRGVHFYFQQPDVPLGNKEGLLEGTGCNVRGVNGYVVGPGSRHESGVLYAPVDPDKPVLPCPTWLVTALTTKAKATTGTDKGFDWGTVEPHTGPIPEGHRHQALVSYAGRLRAMGLTKSEAEVLFRRRFDDCEQPANHEATWESAKASILDDVFDRYSPNDVPDDEPHGRLRLVTFEDITERHIEWLVPNLIPKSEVVIALGEEGIGKGLWWGHLCGTVTTGPDAIDVVVIVAEDSPDATVLPRLKAAGADLRRVHLITMDPETYTGVPTIPGNSSEVADLVGQVRAELVIVDPWLSVVPGGLQVKDTQQARQALDPVTRLARATGAAFVLVTHTNRTASSRPRDLYGATVALRQAGRVCVMALQDPTDHGVVYVGVEKANIMAATPAVKYRKVGVNGSAAWRLEDTREHVGLTIGELVDLFAQTEDGRTTDKWTEIAVAAAQSGGVITRAQVIDIYADASDPTKAANKAIARWRHSDPPRLIAVDGQRGVFEVAGVAKDATSPHFLDMAYMASMGTNDPAYATDAINSDGVDMASLLPGYGDTSGRFDPWQAGESA